MTTTQYNVDDKNNLFNIKQEGWVYSALACRKSTEQTHGCRAEHSRGLRLARAEGARVSLAPHYPF